MLQYIEKLDLGGFVSLKDDCSRDRNLEAARFILRMKDGETKLTVLSLNMHTYEQLTHCARCQSFCFFPGTKLGVTGVVERFSLLRY